MKPFLPLVFAGLLVSPSMAGDVFNGRSLEGWKVQGAEYWSVREGVLTGESDDKKQNSILWTTQSYDDFVMELEFRYHGHVDSGVFLRQENDQIQIGISGSLKRDMTCSPYIANKRGYPIEAKEVGTLLKEGEWNSMKIEARGNLYIVSLAGREVVRYESSSAVDSGPIGLQVHPGLKMKIEFRHVKISPLD
ncbi:MAG: DUF1080 domain-containing protein [Akkermansiaceae bacterium]|jgi:hypothetical protein|nr:DUF1080 domain-containing protein [Akkermansiaceae bacterium]